MVANSNSTLMMIALSALIVISAPVEAKPSKPVTLDERQEQLMSSINQSQLTKALTDKEARSLRSSLADVAHKKAKIKGKKNQLDSDDEQKLRKELDAISETINKKKLDKKLHPEVQAKARAKELESKKAAAEGKEKARAEDLSKAQSKNKDKAKTKN